MRHSPLHMRTPTRAGEPALEAARRKPLIFGLFRGVSVFSGVNGDDGDGGDEGRVTVNVGVAFGQGAPGGQTAGSLILNLAANRALIQTFNVNNLNELTIETNGVKYFSNGTPVAGQQFDYAFDTIGNRTQTLAGGDQNGLNLRTNNYSANNLNQITNRDVLEGAIELPWIIEKIKYGIDGYNEVQDLLGYPYVTYHFYTDIPDCWVFYRIAKPRYLFISANPDPNNTDPYELVIDVTYNRAIEIIWGPPPAPSK